MIHGCLEVIRHHVMANSFLDQQTRVPLLFNKLHHIPREINTEHVEQVASYIYILRTCRTSFESMLGARILGSELGAEIHDSEVPATSTPPGMPCCARLGTSKPRSVAPRRGRRHPGSKDEFMSPKGQNVNFLKKKTKLQKIRRV